MIKYISSVLCGLGLLSMAMPVVAAKHDYKCYIHSTKGDQVLFFSWQEQDAELRAARLVGKQLTDHKGKKYFLKEVEECVLLSEEFTSDKAKARDKRTLR
ncbi:TapY2 family type IVa secretion system protein [Shewanella gaetbuli]|uniref:TapY2 family type IVa secretion system protein n=1 Tax=Shewanella gaetbuli TaxID=220752 RepID=A0A9X1ZFM0_9GAMM|nr:TapY2 family type IVa secretion system protein [Shewanella gaetbuli]MCL1141474.1 TapY2 family type IVa secretion system protein [Shewanella gaetbuli]